MRNFKLLTLLVIVIFLFTRSSCRVSNNLKQCANGIKDANELGIDCGGVCPDKCLPTINNCDNGVQDQGESGIDCGGVCPDCPPVNLCSNGVKDSGETGIDCGGDCPDCPPETLCNNGIKDKDEIDIDCGGACPSCPPVVLCNNGVKDVGEIGIDCGGICPECPSNDLCSNGIKDIGEIGVDCGGTCSKSCCNNGVKDSNETGIDCGGACRKSCCFNGIKDVDETGVDCGGTCNSCCGNGIQDAGETGVDCGGSCISCCSNGIKDNGEIGIDCGGNCPSCCDNGIKDGDEINIDCGGSCRDCCDNGVKDIGETGVDCGGPDCNNCCTNGIQDADETGVDCGGSSCNNCCSNGIQDSGETGIDCGGNCISCCSNGLKDVNETGVDCGGPCPACDLCSNGKRDGNESDIDCGGDCPSCSGDCNNGIKDGNEEGVDCGGSCEPCHSVIAANELLIKNLEVVNSPEALSGRLSFGALINNMATDEISAKEILLSLLNSWKTDQVINAVTIPRRPAIDIAITNNWKKLDGQENVSNEAWVINWANAPFRLTGITNRIDLKDDAQPVVRAGEGRFTYCVILNNDPLEFNWIFEYNLPSSSNRETIEWAKRWHNLSKLDNKSPEFLNNLISVTELFTGKNAMPNRPNGNAISQVRTNEVAIGGTWELREFNLMPSGLFEEVTRKQTPDLSLQGSPGLTQFALQNEQGILDGDIAFPNFFGGAPFLAGNCQTLVDTFKWEVPNVSEELRSTLSILSCNGCHGGEFENTDFTHIKPRSFSEPAELSLFMEEDLIKRHNNVISVLQLPQAPLRPTVSSDERLKIRAFLESKANGLRVH